MGPPPPRRNVVAMRGGGQYHQDLAYYDQQQPGAGAGVNERVREWMLDVERQQAEPDQRSHSSKGKTSPRSNRLKAAGGHRSMSQERMMSTSWSASMGQGYPQHAQSSLEVNKRLGSSMVMPPPSTTNTLRKPVSAANPGELTIAVYTFSHEKGEPMPYRIKIPSKSVTLRHVKEFLPKKGAFR